MKSWITYFAVFTFLGINAKDGLYYAYFKANQSEIIQEHCVSLESSCHASCHLKTKISDKDAQKDKVPAQSENWEQVIQQKANLPDFAFLIKQRMLYYHFYGLTSEEVSFPIDHPPSVLA